MPCKFQYSGTIPATVVNFTHDPDDGDLAITRKWMSPKVPAGAREDWFIYNKSILREVLAPHWKAMLAADWTNLVAFLAAVDGIAESFEFVNSLGVAYTARIWNAREIRSMIPRFGVVDVTVELFITPTPLEALLDETGAAMTGEDSLPLYGE